MPFAIRSRSYDLNGTVIADDRLTIDKAEVNAELADDEFVYRPPDGSKVYHPGEGNSIARGPLAATNPAAAVQPQRAGDAGQATTPHSRALQMLIAAGVVIGVGITVAVMVRRRRQTGQGAR